MPELWDPQTFDLPSKFKILSETDLYMLCESNVVAVEFSEFYLAVMTSDMRIWIFNQQDLNLVRVYEQSASALL